MPVLTDPSDPASEVAEWVGSLDDVTDRARAARRARTLQALTAALAGATTHPQLLDAVLQVCLDGPGAVRATFALAENRGEGAVAGPPDARRPRAPHQRAARDRPRLPLRPHRPRGALPRRRAGVAALPPAFRGFFEAARAAGETAWAVLPLATRRRRLGTLTLGFTEPGVDDAEEREFLLALARQVSTALERVQLLEAQRDTATVLQEVLRPGPLPTVEWLETHRSATTSEGVEVGGDWAETIPLGGPPGRSGSPSCWATSWAAVCAPPP